jgi:hypothetical protein
VIGDAARKSSGGDLTGVAALTLIALALRAGVAFKGGIWSDEGFFLSVIQIHSWTGMLEFLRLHESHPPLFYVLMRAWGSIAGFGERSMLTLPILLGAATVPVTYLVGRTLYSRRTAMIAAALVAISAGLVEYSGQIRPYCLLPILILLSSASLVRARAEGTVRTWLSYSVWTTLALYTHNWVWLIAAGQAVAIGFSIVRRPPAIARLAGGFAASWLLILILYLPWLPDFLFQAAHAGHPPFLVDRSAGVAGLYLFGLMGVPQMLLLGTPPDDLRPVIAVAAVAALGAAIVAGRRAGRAPEIGVRRARENVEADTTFLIIALTSIVIAIAVSPWSNLLIGRVVASMLPMLLLCFASWAAGSLSPVDSRTGPVAAAAVTFVAAAFILALTPGLRHPRSNFRDIAVTLDREKQPGDLLVLASELYAPVFNRYFAESVEQIDFPHPGRSRLVGFANLYERAADSLPLESMRGRIVRAKGDGRRLWLVSSTRVTKPDAREIALGARQRNARIFWRLRIAQVREAVVASYGRPLSTFAPNATSARYDRLKLELFSPTPQ